MKKTPSVFLRNPENMAELTHAVNPEAQWVIDGEGVPTHKYDGTCVMLDENGKWWARREVKKDKPEPPNWYELEPDPITGKRMGYEPIEQSGFYKHWQEAFSHLDTQAYARIAPGTFELCGPKINGNPEGYLEHVVLRHSKAEMLEVKNPKIFGALEQSLSETDIDIRFDCVAATFSAIGLLLAWEGLVWHHPDGRMAKLKVRDFKNVKDNT